MVLLGNSSQHEEEVEIVDEAEDSGGESGWSVPGVGSWKMKPVEYVAPAPQPSPSPEPLLEVEPKEAVALTWSEVTSPAPAFQRRPATATQSKPVHPPAAAWAKARPFTAQMRARRVSLGHPPSAAPVGAPLPSDNMPRYMRTTRACGVRHASRTQDSAHMAGKFGLPSPAPRPQPVPATGLAVTDRPGLYRRAWRFVEAGERDQNYVRPRSLSPRGADRITRQGQTLHSGPSTNVWLLQSPMHRRVVVNAFGGAVGASLSYATPQPRWKVTPPALPPITVGPGFHW